MFNAVSSVAEEVNFPRKTPDVTEEKSWRLPEEK